MGASASTTRQRILLDCDPGHDDAAAMVVAAHYGDLVGVTTVGGNAPLADVTTNALLTAQIFGIDVDVHPGCDRPLVAEPLNAPEVHGVSGFAGPSLPTLERTASTVGAIEYIIETIRAEDGLWLVPTGPLTNIAMVIRRAPDVVDRVAGISFMGGSAEGGNRTAAAEFNALVDPEAVKVVVDCGARIVMSGLDLTRQFVVDDRLADDLAALGSTGALVFADLIRAYLDKAEERGLPRRGGLHDPCAVLAVTHPEAIERTARPVDVELGGRLTRGMTVVDRRPPANAAGRSSTDRRDANVEHCHTLDHDRCRQLFLDAVAALGSAS
ncbi:MAG: nucleoside hydrolase [Acidimicrobiia bacterium]|nr:nucleoside hydrolase [Acidimicrobiia bacterium]